MSKTLGAGKTLELLEELRQTVAELSAKAEQVAFDFRSRTARERQLAEAAQAELERSLAASLSGAETIYQEARQKAEAAFQSRKVWIGRAYQSSKETVLSRIESREGSRKYDLQKRMLQAEKDRDSGLAGAAAAFEEFRRLLATDQETLSVLERDAQRSLRGYRSLTRGFARAYENANPDASGSADDLLGRLREHLRRGEGELKTLNQHLLFRLFRFLPLWVVLGVCPVGIAALMQARGYASFTYAMAAGVGAAVIVLAVVFRFVAGSKATNTAGALSRTLADARKLHDLCSERSDAQHRQEMERVRNQFETTTREADSGLKKAVAEAGQSRIACRMEADQRTVQVTEKLQVHQRRKLSKLEADYSAAVQVLKLNAETQRVSLGQRAEEKLSVLRAGFDTQWQQIETEWNNRIKPVYAALDDSREVAEALFPPWTELLRRGWSPPKVFAQSARFGEAKVDAEKLCELAPKDRRLELPGPLRFTVPLSLSFPGQGSLLFETSGSGQSASIGALNNIILRLLSVAPPGRLNFTIIDPVGLGQNFAGVMHLADYEEQIITNRIWTQSTQIEQRLGELNEHMEKVIQMYLRNEYQTIADYNEQAGVIAEKYHLLVVADFPAGFSDIAARRLMSIAASGARCGVYTLIHWDRRQPLPQDFIPEELRKSSFCLTAKGDQFLITGKFPAGIDLVLDAPPEPDAATEFIHQVGVASRDSSRVEVPFEQIAPPEAEMWQEKTANELRVPIGRTGATKLQYLEIGKGTRQHALIAGKTGSGKSTLFHVLITNLALWCSPEEVEFYLVDFKKGVEFKCYGTRRLPHARVVAIESDREFGLSVLQRVDDELKRRGDLFRKLGVQDLPGYKRAGGTEPVPRSLLVIDEFQELFVEDDKVSQTASLLLDRIVRQGRAFGIHVLLGSQTLGGAYTVARTTLGQMVIRIALQCNEADAALIMDDTNPAPRLLSRPGEGIYNDAAGALEGNSPFQVVWLPDDVRDRYLAKARALADQHGDAYPGPIVFEGNAPADVAENLVLQRLVEGALPPAGVPARTWLGAPNSIKGPTEVAFRRQSGNHLLIVGQRDEAILAMAAISFVSLAAHYAPGAARFLIVDGSAPGSPPRDYLEHLATTIPRELQLVKPAELGEVMKELRDEMKRRADAADAESAPPIFLFIHGLQKFGKLRYEEDFSFSSGEGDAEVKPGAALNELVCEGARLGIHVIATCDTYNNLNRSLSRKAVSEFEMRILFQMSANDSASLIDNPKASMLGLHRALLHNAQEGYLETFRPYALPAQEWMDQVGARLGRQPQGSSAVAGAPPHTGAS